MYTYNHYVRFKSNDVVNLFVRYVFRERYRYYLLAKLRIIISLINAKVTALVTNIYIHYSTLKRIACPIHIIVLWIHICKISAMGVNGSVYGKLTHVQTGGRLVRRQNRRLGGDRVKRSTSGTPTKKKKKIYRFWTCFGREIGIRREFTVYPYATVNRC